MARKKGELEQHQGRIRQTRQAVLWTTAPWGDRVTSLYRRRKSSRILLSHVIPGAIVLITTRPAVACGWAHINPPRIVRRVKIHSTPRPPQLITSTAGGRDTEKNRKQHRCLFISAEYFESSSRRTGVQQQQVGSEHTISELKQNRIVSPHASVVRRSAYLCLSSLMRP